MKPVDFSDYRISNKYYGGSEKKIGIIVDGFEYMLKFQKKTPFGYRNNHICEYLGSHIFDIAGFDVQKTYLGIYQGSNVVACKDFNVKNRQFVPFNDVGESTLDQDKESYQYDYEDIMRMLRDNSKLTNVERTISMFWELYIMDAFLGNFDRHGGNWGFIKENNRYTLAPVFDNGSCLFPNMTDEDEMIKIIDSEEETDKRVYSFPTSQVKLDGKKSSYYEVINSHRYPECDAALENVYQRLDFSKVKDLIYNTEMLSEVQKEFYIHILKARYEKILMASIETLKQEN